MAAYEIENALLSGLSKTLELCRQTCAEAGIKFRAEVRHEDFIDAAVQGLEPTLFRHESAFDFNCAILNPPYRKIQSNSKTRRLLRRVGIETSNLYSAFVALAIKLLGPAGQLVAITPRSFCNGPYFRPFRDLLLDSTALTRIHVFESRKTVFSDDDVLQENVIFHAVKGRRGNRIIVSSSVGPSDETESRSLRYEKVVRPNDPERFIRLTISAQDERATTMMGSLEATLSDLGVQVSTGRVVEFRAREHLRDDPSDDTVPLIYPCHFREGFVHWPTANGRKPNALVACEQTSKLVVPAGTYVLTKRFTSKEERRRLVAAIYDPSRVTRTDVGFENHLNYFHIDGRGLPAWLARGLWLFLNSSFVDQYFRQFSGHTQVNATDLRSLRYPNTNHLRAIAKHAGEQLPEQVEIDRVVDGVIRG